ncbi:MAG TPA: hypothetical protein VF069_07800 [Streptosporangiaceae bacterium]
MSATAAPTSPAAAAPTEVTRAARQPACEGARPFDRRDFPGSPKVDNPFLPLRPGMRFVLKGTDSDEEETVARRVQITVTDLTKVVGGVRTIVVLEQDFTDGVLTEDEIAFRAQEANGTWVWELGEYPEEFDEKGKFAGAPSTWLQGVRGGLGGIAMPADQKHFRRAYLQAFAPGKPEDIIFDCARLFRTNQQTSVPAGHFRNVLVTEEWNALDPLEPHQLKYYAAGVGLVRVGVAGDQPGEKLMLTEARRLCRQQLKASSDHALRLDQRAYTNARGVFTANIPHAKRTLGVKPCGSSSRATGRR